MYIFCSRGLVACRRSRLNSNVRPRITPTASCLVRRVQPCLATAFAPAAHPEFATAQPAALTSCGVRGKMSQPVQAHDCHRRCSSRQPRVYEASHLKEPNRFRCGTTVCFSRSHRCTVVVHGVVTRHGCESVTTEEYRCNKPRPPRFGAFRGPSQRTGLRSSGILRQ